MPATPSLSAAAAATEPLPGLQGRAPRLDLALGLRGLGLRVVARLFQSPPRLPLAFTNLELVGARRHRRVDVLIRRRPPPRRRFWKNRPRDRPRGRPPPRDLGLVRF